MAKLLLQVSEKKSFQNHTTVKNVSTVFNSNNVQHLRDMMNQKIAKISKKGFKRDQVNQGNGVFQSSWINSETQCRHTYILYEVIEYEDTKYSISE
jgi:hypothetical protein